ncbi:MAG: DNA polymerase III subunit gamma/tau [Spirochaetales bacterium]
MSYEVTANKKRPIQFDGLLGQEFVVATLKNSIDTGRIAHAYLFSGPRGVGKTSAARILARSLNCPDAPSSDGCPDFEEGDAISRGTALDVIEIDGASNTSVNDVRQIKDEVLFAPQSARYKIYIIDEVHMLSNSAFNALLKTIEEPPPYIVFIFATTEIHKVPATIRSRCQQFHFRLIPLQEVAGALRQATTELDLEADEDALLWMAKEASGSLRDAFTLFDQVASFSTGRITLADIQQKLGLTGFEQLDELVRLLGEGRISEGLALVDTLLSAGISIEQLVTDLGEYFRTALLVKHGVVKTGVLGRPADSVSEEVLESFSEVQLQKGLDMTLELYRNLRYSLNPRFELELVASRIAELPNYLSPREMLDEIARLRGGKPARHPLLTDRRSAGPGSPETDGATNSGGQASGGQPTGGAEERVERGDSGESDVGSEETPAGDASAQPGITETGHARQHQPTESSETLDDRQQQAYSQSVRSQVINSIRQQKLALGSVLERAVAWTMHEGALVIQFSNGYHARAVKQDNGLIRETLREITGDDVPVKAAIVTDEAEETEQQSHSQQVALVKRVFRGEVIDGDGEDGSS